MTDEPRTSGEELADVYATHARVPWPVVAVIVLLCGAPAVVFAAIERDWFPLATGAFAGFVLYAVVRSTNGFRHGVRSGGFRTTVGAWLEMPRAPLGRGIATPVVMVAILIMWGISMSTEDGVTAGYRLGGVLLTLVGVALTIFMLAYASRPTPDEPSPEEAPRTTGAPVGGQLALDLDDLTVRERSELVSQVLASVVVDATHAEADIPWSEHLGWPADVRAAAERLQSAFVKPRDLENKYQATRVRELDDASIRAAFVTFAPFAYDAGFWIGPRQVASLADCGQSVVLRIDARQHADVIGLVGAERIRRL